MNSFVDLLAVVGLGCKMPFLGPDANCKRHHGTPVPVLCCQFVSRALCPLEVEKMLGILLLMFTKVSDFRINFRRAKLSGGVYLAGTRPT